MRDPSVEAKVLGGFGFALLVLVVIGGFAYRSATGFVDTAQAIARSHEAIVHLEELFSLLTQAEAAQRGYLITGEEPNLETRTAVLTGIGDRLSALALLMENDPDQKERLSLLGERVMARVDLLDWVLEARNTLGVEEAQRRLAAQPGVREMAAVRELLVEMERHERVDIVGQPALIRAKAERALVIFAASLLVSVAFLSLLFVRIRYEIHERVKAEHAVALQAERLRDSEARTRAIVETATDGIVVVTEKGTIERFNPAAQRMFGYSEADIKGKHVSLLIAPAYLKEHSPFLWASMASGGGRAEPASHEMLAVRSDATEFPIELTVGEMRLGGQRFFAGIIRDITERKELDRQRTQLIQELESANEELRNFAHGVSHDLKAPLRAIGSLADWIAADYSDKLDDQGREHIRLLKGRVYRMNRLIEGILEYSRLGRVKETKVNVDLNVLVQEVVDLLAPTHNVTVVVSNHLPTIVADRTRIQQVFQNIIDNAIKYMDKPDGRVEIRCRPEGNEWVFSIADNGPGIEQRHFERIFQLFQTLAPRDKVESTGVGLSVAKKIVEMYGGRIWVESTVGVGSTFLFTIPFSTAAGEVNHNTGEVHAKNESGDSVDRG